MQIKRHIWLPVPLSSYVGESYWLTVNRYMRAKGRQVEEGYDDVQEGVHSGWKTKPNQIVVCGISLSFLVLTALQLLISTSCNDDDTYMYQDNVYFRSENWLKLRWSKWHKILNSQQTSNTIRAWFWSVFNRFLLVHPVVILVSRCCRWCRWLAANATVSAPTTQNRTKLNWLQRYQ